MIKFFSKIGQINESMRIFNRILNENKTIVTYIVMMQSYNENQMYDKTIKSFNSNEPNEIKNDIMPLSACRESKTFHLVNLRNV